MLTGLLYLQKRPPGREQVYGINILYAMSCMTRHQDGSHEVYKMCKTYFCYEIPEENQQEYLEIVFEYWILDIDTGDLPEGWGLSRTK